MDLDNIQRKYGLPAPLPVVQNGKFATRFPLNLEHRGDNVFQFGGKYIGEIENIYDLLYKILTNQEIDASLALPYAIKITEDKLYIRDKTNSEWITIFDITKPNFPKEIELYELIYKAITHQVIGEDTSYPGQFKIEENILYVRDKDNLTWTQIGDVTKEFLGATEATQAILDQVNEILTEVQELKTELNRQIATTNETLTTALKAANEAMTSAQSINIRTFNSVEEMKASNTLKAGALAKTLGFYTAGDGGGTDYAVVDNIGDEYLDNDSIIQLQKGLCAVNLRVKELINEYNINTNPIPFNNIIGFCKRYGTNKLDPLGNYNDYGVYNVRISFIWRRIEKEKGVYTFDVYDDMIQQSSRNNIKVLAILGHDNLLYGTDITNEEVFNGFINYVKATVQHYKDNPNIIWECWNEPNEISWNLSESEYIKILKECNKVIKEINPKAIICAPALSFRYENLYALDYLNNLCELGLLNYCDKISIHPYAAENPEDLESRYNKMQYILAKYNIKNIEVFCSEVGYSIVPNPSVNNANFKTEEERAKLIPRIILNNLTKGIYQTYLYTSITSQSDETDGEDWYGIFNTDGTDTETTIALKNLNSMLTDTYYLDTYYKSYTARILRFMNNKGEYIFVGWTVNPQGEQIILNGEVISLTDYVKKIDITNIYLSDYKVVKEQNDMVGMIYNKGFKTGEVLGNYALNTATGSFSLSTGNNTIASGEHSFSAGNLSKAFGINSVAMGYNTKAYGMDSIAMGYNTIALGKHSFVAGSSNIVSRYGTAFGKSNVAITNNFIKITSFDDIAKTLTLENINNLSVGDEIVVFIIYAEPLLMSITAINGNIITVDTTKTFSDFWLYVTKIDNSVDTTDSPMAIGRLNISCGKESLSSGFFSMAKQECSHALGYGILSNNFSCTVVGKYNVESTQESSYDTATNGDGFIVGNGYYDSSSKVTHRRNAFRVDYNGNAYAQSTINGTGADYAEYFEWEDGNVQDDDRIGKFVTLNNNKIKIATPNDYILGVITETPNIIGNSYQDEWQGKYITDDFNRIIYDKNVIPEYKDIDGNIIPEHTVVTPRINPEYDGTKKYIPRKERKEWAIVGMLGVLIVKDDGTCSENGYCAVNNDGIATTSPVGYRVIERITDNIIKIIFK